MTHKSQDMLSSDKNIQSIAQIIEALKDYLSLEKECLKFDIVDRLVRISTAVILFMVIFVLSVGVLFYSLGAFVAWMTPMVGEIFSNAIMAVALLILIIIAAMNRKGWIERPLTRFFANIIFK